MSVTIKDVAKEANVSPSTVSRVLSDSDKISEKTKRKVRKVMNELGYHINYNARVLVQKSTKTIGIVMKHSATHSWHNPFFPEVLRGISTYCHKLDYSISLTTGESEESIYKEVVKMVHGKRIDGIIVLYSKKDDKVVPFLIEQQVPFVVIGKPMEHTNEIMYVDNDNVQAGKEAAEFLIDLGHEEIGFIGDNPDFQVIQDRMNGFKEALLSNDLFYRDEYIKYVDDNNNRKIVTELFNQEITPTALVISSDIQAIGILKLLHEIGYRVPDDISIVTFNKTFITELSIPSLTTVNTQTYQLGYESSRCLIELINEPEMFKRSVIIPTVIEVNDSHQKVLKV
ncbi:transcriptional regulator involved in carbon catabolite control [Oceanobacillus iheyensis HTE831]|uniref:Transcriptional regulator involved in carbon catabolite control n=1 Tax=Oceanobacillus iheyensis (strain DSM 14371 / CIP 107618 / JCM 11309 / KCTC 3954 / HTE831) TaxID=221109 RepID=Q8ENC0_OCEIH|nr:LacI family DNA-binding transcriptional regulator [Oceanobacillus iheyensis]BAC14523.1 transcriptional regulator involved in carbon catabolite control [Oceanobacillus iheyensis HTE831]